MVNEFLSRPSEHSEPVVFPPVIPAAGFLAGILLESGNPFATGMPAWWRFGMRAAGAVDFCRPGSPASSGW